MERPPLAVPQARLGWTPLPGHAAESGNSETVNSRKQQDLREHETREDTSQGNTRSPKVDMTSR